MRLQRNWRWLWWERSEVDEANCTSLWWIIAPKPRHEQTAAMTAIKAEERYSELNGDICRAVSFRISSVLNG